MTYIVIDGRFFVQSVEGAMAPKGDAKDAFLFKDVSEAALWLVSYIAATGIEPASAEIVTFANPEN